MRTGSVMIGSSAGASSAWSAASAANIIGRKNFMWGEIALRDAKNLSAVSFGKEGEVFLRDLARAAPCAVRWSRLSEGQGHRQIGSRRGRRRSFQSAPA